VKVYDLVGNILIQSKNILKIDLSGMKNGIYFLVVTTDKNDIFTHKIILTKN
jgi:hypothetical protein